jgi:hypothetical protein
MIETIPCRRCSRPFQAFHGNQRLCAGCRNRRQRPPVLGRVSFGLRRCDWCGREFEAFADHARFCGAPCRTRALAVKDRLLYANRRHRGTRAALAEVVALGYTRCARGRWCRFAEVVDGELLGGYILPNQKWHLGHADEESSGGAEHAVCNLGGPSRIRARRRRREWQAW